MSNQSIAEWVVCVTSNRLPSQSRTLAALVAAVGRKMGGSAKSAIQRAWRFTRNRRVEVAEAMAGVSGRIARRRRKPLLIRFDGTDVRDLPTRMAAACIGGRAVPLLWASYAGSKRRRSQNAPEGRLLRTLKGLLPGAAEVIVLAGRGVGRAGWAAVCQEPGFRYVVRIKPDVTAASARYRGVLRKYPAHEGMAHVLRGVDSRKGRRVRHNIVVRWQPGLPKGRDEPWYLMTDLEAAPSGCAPGTAAG